MSSPAGASKHKFKPDDVKENAQPDEDARCENQGVAGACTCLLVCAVGSNCIARLPTEWRVINTMINSKNA